MADMYKEIMVNPDMPTSKRFLKGFFPVMAVVCFLGGILFIPLWIGTVAFIVLAIFMTPRFDVEYEYLYVNGELDIDAIYSKKKRKKIGRYDMDQLEILAPSRSHALDYYMNKPGEKINDYTSQKEPEKNYTLVFNKDNKRNIVILELDDSIINDIRRIAPRKVNLY